MHVSKKYLGYLNDTDNHDGVITHLEPDIMECEVKWAWNMKSSGPQEALLKNKASGGDGIPAKLF